MCLRDALISLGWVACASEPAVFRKKDSEGRYMLHTAYVDDGTIFAYTEADAERERSLVLEKFAGRKEEPTKIESDGTEHRVLLGMNITYNRRKRTVSLTRDTSVEKLLEKCGFSKSEITATPGADNASGKAAPDDYPFRKVVGSLMWVGSITRPDVMYPVKSMSERLASPPVSSVAAAQRTAKFLKGTKSSGLYYSLETESDFDEEYPNHDPKNSGYLRAYCDASYADTNKSRSTTGNIVFFRGVPVWWRSRNQSITSLSTCESEFVSAFECAKELVTLRSLSQFILGWGAESDCVIPLLCDNKSAIQVATSVLMSTKRTRHFKTRYFWLRDACQNHVDLQYVDTKYNRADALTKPLSRKVLDFMMRRISMSALREHYQKGS